MKQNMTSRLFGIALDQMIRGEVKDKKVRTAIQQEYKTVYGRAKDIGEKNNLLSSYCLAAYFIAMCRKAGNTPEENYHILDRAMGKSRLLKLMMGDSKSYLSEKRLKFRMEWSKQTYQRQYENDWVVDVLPSNGDYDLGYDYWECGVCKLCRDENCPELAHWLCKLDFLLSSLIGLRLERTETLADGGEKCDFRFYKK